MSSSGVTFSREAIWSMKAPVPPAQVPFIRSSTPPVRKRILASSPPSSMTMSMLSAKRSTALLVAKTSWTNSMPAALAKPKPAEPDRATVNSSPPMTGAAARRTSAVFCRTWEKWRS